MTIDRARCARWPDHGRSLRKRHRPFFTFWGSHTATFHSLTPILAPQPFLELLRVGIGPDGAFGVLKHAGVPFAVTLERTYEVDGTQRVKIPPGRYRCTRTRFIRGGYDTYEIHVPGHSRILFHIANVEGELEGCVAVADSFGELGPAKIPAVLRSRIGFQRFWQMCGGRTEFELEVV